MAALLSDVFLKALASGLQHFNMTFIKVRFDRIENEIEALSSQMSSMKIELNEMNQTVDRLKSSFDAEVRAQVHQALGRLGRGGATNADILCCFIQSLKSHITAITFKGLERQTQIQTNLGSDNEGDDEPDELRHFVCNTMSVEQILDNISKLAEYDSITGGRIATGFISTEEEMNECGHSIAVICRTFKIFNLNCCTISAESDYSADRCIVLRFENRYDLSLFRQVKNPSIESKPEYVRSSRRNVYILGQNGAGKSTWGNLIANQTPFEVGISNHTTMIPLSYDVQYTEEFRLWDTPGLFDGTPEEGSMQDHMNYVIDMNEYCSSVLFVFPRGRPPDSSTHAMLDYAIERVGPFVKKNFVAILNDGESGADTRCKVFRRVMRQKGFEAGHSNVMTLSAVDATPADIDRVKLRLGEYEEQLVEKHRRTYEEFLKKHEHDQEGAIRNLFKKSQEELENILRRGRITVRHNGADKSIPRDIIRFEQNSKSYIKRVLRIGMNRVINTKIVKIKGNSNGAEDLISKVHAKMSTEYRFSQASIFTNHFLSRDSFILLHSPRGISQYNYELWDTSNMRDSEIRSLVQRTLGDLRF